MAIERTAQARFDQLTKMNLVLAQADPHDKTAPYHTIYDLLPKDHQDEWWAAVKDVAMIQWATQHRFAKEIIDAAIRHGLVPQGTRRLDRPMYIALKNKGFALRSIVYAQIDSAGKTRGIYSTITRHARSKR